MIYLTEFGNLLTRLNSTVRTQYGVESVLRLFLAQGNLYRIRKSRVSTQCLRFLDTEESRG
jgi:hypothetical protein